MENQMHRCVNVLHILRTDLVNIIEVEIKETTDNMHCYVWHSLFHNLQQFLEIFYWKTFQQNLSSIYWFIYLTQDSFWKMRLLHRNAAKRHSTSVIGPFVYLFHTRFFLKNKITTSNFGRILRKMNKQMDSSRLWLPN